MRSPPESSSRHPTPTTRTADEGDTRRIDQLAQAVDCCTEAKRIAEAVGEKFLAYLLAMAIQETRGAMRAEVDLRSRVP